MTTRKARQIEHMENFNLDETNADDRIETAMISLWIPLSYKEKFDKIQKKSQRKFSKYLKQVVIESIDNVRIDD